MDAVGNDLQVFIKLLGNNDRDTAASGNWDINRRAWRASRHPIMSLIPRPDGTSGTKWVSYRLRDGTPDTRGRGHGGPPRERVDRSPQRHCAGPIMGQARAEEARGRLSQSHYR